MRYLVLGHPPFPVSRRGRVASLLLFVFLFLAFGAGALWLQHRQLRQIQRERPYRDSLFLPRKEFAKALAFGYDSFVADFLYLRSIQAFGGQWSKAIDKKEDYKRVVQYFITIAELAPHFIEAYEFGSMVVGEDGGDPRKAIELNRVGWLKNPDKYRLAYLNTYAAWWNLQDPDLTRFWTEMALKAPDCPDHISRMLSYVDRNTGRYAAALERWISDYLEAVANENSHMLSISEGQLLDITDQWNLTILHEALQKYRDDHNGNLPANLDEMVRAGYLQNYESVNFQVLMDTLQGYRYTGLVPPGAQKLAVEKSFGLASGIPQSPYGPDPKRHYYFLRQDVDPEDFEVVMENKAMIMSMQKARGFTSKNLRYVRTKLEEFQEEQGRNPENLQELFPHGLKALDPKRGSWDYDPKAGTVHSPTFPDL